MSKHGHEKPERPDTAFDELTEEQQYSLLKATARAARLRHEELAASGATEQEFAEARQARLDANVAQVTFEIEHGYLDPPEE